MTEREGYIIRPMQPSDIGVVTELLRHNHTNSPFVAVPFDESSTVRELEFQLDNPDAILLIAADDITDGAIGYIGGELIPFNFNDQALYARMLARYVDPGVRGLGIGGKLLEAFEAAAQAKKAKAIVWHIMGSASKEALESAKKRDYHLAEVGMFKAF